MLLLLLFLLFPLMALNAFVVDPWFNTIAEFTFRPSYTYRYSSTPERSPCYIESHPLHTHRIDLNLGVRFLPCWEVQVETDFSKTGAQVRYLLFDDVAGDLFSIVLGGQVFYISKRIVLHDEPPPLSVAKANVEVGVSIGKEGADLYQWFCRSYGFLGMGLDGRGSLWIRPLLSQEVKVARSHLFQLFAEGYMGWGRHFHDGVIDITHQSSGYAKRRRRSSIDIGVGYTYLLDIWGALSLRYVHRLCAHACLRKHHSLRIEYCLPFSLF